MEKRKKCNPILFTLKLAAFMFFWVIPICSWKAGQDLWKRRHEKEYEK